MSGDHSGRSGRRVRLPVDGYWPFANLVVEYRERQHGQSVPHFDKPARLTVSGVHRGIQRALYDARREELIPRHGIRLVIITPADLDARIAKAVDAAVARQIRPLLEAYDAADGRVRFNDLIGGLGWIAGIAGLWAWFRSRRSDHGH